MIEAVDLCECMEELIERRKVQRHVPPYSYLAEGTYALDGQLCMVNDVVEDLGYYDDYQWVPNIKAYRELYPIKFCPICGKEIKYKRYNSLTMKY